MNLLNETMINFIDLGYSVRKINDKKFTIKKPIVNCNIEITVEHLTDSHFAMYKKYMKRYNSWNFDINYKGYNFDHHYEAACKYDASRLLKTANLLNAKLDMKLYVKHRNFDAYPEYKNKSDDIKHLYDTTTTKIWKLILQYKENPELFLRDKDIPKSLKCVAIGCKGELENFVYGIGWNSSPYYLSRLIMDVSKYLSKYNVQI